MATCAPEKQPVFSDLSSNAHGEKHCEGPPAVSRSRSEAGGGACRARWTSAEHGGVDHRGLEVAMAQEFLDGADVVAVLQQVGGEGVS